MADGNVIDTLSIEISANADKAAKGLAQLETRLRGLAVSVKNLSGAAHSLGVLSTSLQKMGNVNTSNIAKAIDQFERLSKLDLHDKRIKLDVQLTGASEAERRVHAIETAMRSVDVSGFSKRINDAFKLSGADAKATTEALKKSLDDVSKGGTGMTGMFSIMDTIKQSGEIAKSSFDSSIAAIKQEYDGLLQYLKQYPIKIKAKNDDLGINSSERMSYFSQKTGISIDDRWSKMLGKFPAILSGLEQVINDEDMVVKLFERIHEAQKQFESTTPIKVLNGEQEETVWNHIISTLESEAGKMKEIYSDAFNASMRDSVTKIPLDVSITGAKIETKIKQAIKEATSGKTYNVPINIRIDDKEFKANLKNILSGVQVGDFDKVAVALQNFAVSAQTIGQTNFKDNGFRSFVNSIDKISKVTISPSLVTGLKDIANGLGAFANVKNVSSGVTRLVTALAKLASTGGTIKQVTAELPNFSTAIRDVATKLSQLGGVSPDMTQFITAMGQLANVGNKMPEAAKNMDAFSDAVKRMIQAIGGQNVNADVAQLVTALSQLSASMAQAGRNFSGGGGNGGSGVSSFNSGFTLFKKILNEITKLANKAAHLIVSAFKKIGQGIATIVKGAVAKLEELKKSIMSLASSVASSAFGKIKSGLSGILNISEIQNATHSMYSLSDSIKVVIGSLLGMRGITGIFSWLKDAVSAGGDITEINHIIESVFEEDMVGYVNAWADNAIEKFGIASGAAKQYAGVLSSMFQSSGISKSDAGKMGMRLTELAGDLSAFYNIDTETAYQKLKSGMAGMVRPLRDLGIDLSVATLQEYALTQGITKSVTAMTQAEKVMLRYNYLLSVTETQQNDFARTADSFANSLRTVKAYAQAVSTQIGVGLAAALRHVLILVRTLLKGVLQLATTFANFMQTVFGKYKGGASGMAMDLGAADDYGSDLADSADDTASGLGNAADAAEKLRKELSVLPFDELNQLNKDQEKTSTGGTGGNGGSGTGGGLGDLGDIGDILDLEELIEGSALPDAISKWGQRIRDAFLAHDWEGLGKTIADMLNEGFQFIYDLIDPKKVKEKVEPYITAFGITFNSLVDRLDFDLIGRVIGRGLNDIAMLFNMWYESIDFVNLGAKLAEGLNGILTEANFEEIGTALGNKFMIAWDIFSGFVADENIWTNVGIAIADGITGLNNAIRLGDIGTTLTNLANGLFTTLDEAMTGIPWGDVAKNITSGINNFIGGFKWSRNGQILGQFVTTLFGFIQQLLAGQNWGELGKGIADFIAGAIRGLDFTTISSAVDTAMGSVFSFFTNFVDNLPFTEIGSALATGLNIITTNFNKWYEKLDLEGLGARLAEGVRTLFDDVSFTELGSALGNKFMIGWRIFKGFVSDGELWVSIGHAIANGIKGLTKTVRLGEIGSALAELCNGLATTLGVIADDDEMWDGVVDNIVNGIATFLAEFEWEKNGEKLNKFLMKLCESISRAVHKTDWEQIGTNLAIMLSKIEWLKVLATVADVICTALGGLIKGLIKKPEGAVAVAIVTGLALLNITSKIASSAIGGMIIKGIAGSIAKQGSSKVLGDAVSTAVSSSVSGSGAAATADAALGTAFGGGLLLVGLVKAAKGMSEFVDSARGGNGVINSFGTAVDTLTQSLVDSNKLTTEQAQSIFALKESGEEAGKSQTQIAAEVINLLGEFGITGESARQTAEGLAIAGRGDAEAFEILAGATNDVQSAQLLLNGQSLTTQQAITNLSTELLLAAGNSSEFAGQYDLAREALSNSSSEIHSADEAYHVIINSMGEGSEAAEAFKQYLASLGYQFGETATSAGTSGANISKNLGIGLAVTTPISTSINNIKGMFNTMFSTNESGSQKSGGNMVTKLANGIGAFTPVKNKIAEIAKAFDSNNKTMENDSNKTGGNIVTKLTNGIGTFTAVKNKMQEISSDIHNKYTSIEGDSNKTGGNVVSKFAGGIGLFSAIAQKTEAIKKNFSDKYSLIQSDATETGKKTVSNMAFGLADLLKLALNLAAMRLLVTNTFDKVKEDATTTGKDLISNLSSGIASKSYEISATCNEIADSIRKAFDIGLYDYGRSAGQSFANGIGSVSIPLPHVEVGWDTIYLYDGSWFQTPNFSVNWYRAGGLFRGGNGQLIGIAEDGRDEAVLPLENRRTMSMIADSIVNASSGGMGISKDDIVDGVVEALLTAQNNQQNPTFYIEVKTEDDEVLARAVTRGQQSIDYRNNPTPSLA